MYKSLFIRYGQDLVLEYRLRNHAIVQRWAQQLELAQQQYPIDDPCRFYGFGSLEDQAQDAVSRINKNIQVIKSHLTDLLGDYVKDVGDQDLLNYWHHVFEVYHGLLDHTVEGIPNHVRACLADLNVCVHRCESVARGAKPRHVVTYYGLPKTEQLEESDYDLFTQTWSPGTVCLNYVEIGKTLEVLSEDNDRYIGDDAFRPFKHFSADFNVRFFGQTDLQAAEKNNKIQSYYLAHQDFFGAWKKSYTGGVLPLADLVNDLDLEAIATRQQVTEVKLV